ncbi:hypothetical protein I203_101464 [Kwoniella mangroviensis CBS 8507]|uniref:uncharacterized protein n=1 Tax=Kwoniella mangroviensis CBS 8507 TaxID=1296122 RepID=UPI00080D66B2|nr:uncharacterized protein I203_05517 [Kwoniella mangroviensis CBS 8507]OCF65271.1 hypothetical protein I203_05517 [Kwoniella mangroviensis CBS 8507]
MPRNTAKRSRLPSSIDSRTTPPPKTKKPRTSKTGKPTLSTRRTSGIKHSSTVSEGQAEKDDPDDTSSDSSPSSSSSQDQDSDEDEDVMEHSTRNSNSNSDSDMKHQKEVIIAMVDRIKSKQLRRILEDSAKYLRKDGTDLDNPGKDDVSDMRKVRNIWERVMENWDDSEEEDEIAVVEEAEKLANALTAPFDKLQAQSTSSLNEVTYTVNQAFQNALEPFRKDIILEQLKLSEAAQARLAQQTAERWDFAMAHVAHKQQKFQEVMRQIHAIKEEKKQLMVQAKKDFDAALERQAAEIEGFKKRIRESQERCREQLIKAQDQDRINKEVNMLMAKFLNGDRT